MKIMSVRREQGLLVMATHRCMDTHINVGLDNHFQVGKSRSYSPLANGLRVACMILIAFQSPICVSMAIKKHIYAVRFQTDVPTTVLAFLP